MCTAKGPIAPRRRPGTPAAAALTIVAAALAAALALPLRADAVMGRTNPPHPILRPPHGHPFMPTLGNWEGTTRGFSASFELVYEPALPTRGSRPRYGVSDLVVTRPGGCPVAPSRFAETLVTGRAPLSVDRSGALGLIRFGFAGALTARRSATLLRGWRLSCGHGVLRWSLHPVRRRPVTDGTWTVRSPGQPAQRFAVRQGGRLAVSVPLPQGLKACGGAIGAIDLFIGPGGLATLHTQSVDASVRFRRTSASGTFDAGARGCAHGPIRFSATAG